MLKENIMDEIGASSEWKWQGMDRSRLLRSRGSRWSR